MTRPEHAPSRQFAMDIEIAAPRDTVWKAIAVDSELTRWFAPQARVVPGSGGEMSWRWDEYCDWVQTIDVWEPGVRLRTRYDSSVDDEDGGKVPLFVEFQLQGEGGTTKLRLVHSGFGSDAAFDDEFNGISGGWPVELRSLRLYLEMHLGKERNLVWCTAPVEMSADEAWRRVTGDEGLCCGPDVQTLAEGDSFRIRTVDGDELSGEVLHCHAHAFTGVARSHDDSFLRVSVFEAGGVSHVWLWLATYGTADPENESLRARWETMLGRLFPERVNATFAGKV